MADTLAKSPRGRKRVLGTLIIDEDDRVFVKSPRVGLHEAPATTTETVRLLQMAAAAASPAVPAAAAAASAAAASATTPAAAAAPSTPPFALDRLPDELLARVLACMPTTDLVPCAQVCQKWGQLAEQQFRTTCRRQNWILPRRPRGIYATTPWPWRFLWLEHVCKACRKPGAFPIFTRAGRGERQVALACKHCILNSAHLRTQLEANSLTVATVSTLGKHLLPKSERWAR